MYRNLYPIFEECIENCRRIGIPVSDNITKLSISGKMSRTYGKAIRRQCYGTYVYEIRISKRLLDERIPINVVKNTMYHELIHTCDGCWDHGSLFLHYGKIVEQNTGLIIQRYVGMEEQKQVTKYYNDRQYKYFIVDKYNRVVDKYKNKTKFIQSMLEYPDYYAAQGYRVVTM